MAELNEDSGQLATENTSLGNIRTPRLLKIMRRAALNNTTHYAPAHSTHGVEYRRYNSILLVVSIATGWLSSILSGLKTATNLSKTQHMTSA